MKGNVNYVKFMKGKCILLLFQKQNVIYCDETFIINSHTIKKGFVTKKKTIKKGFHIESFFL